MNTVFSGADKEAILAYAKRQNYELFLLLSGQAKRTIYLNGGSDTRRDVYEHYKEQFTPWNINVSYFGWCVVIGGLNDRLSDKPR